MGLQEQSGQETESLQYSALTARLKRGPVTGRVQGAWGKVPGPMKGSWGRVQDP